MIQWLQFGTVFRHDWLCCVRLQAMLRRLADDSADVVAVALGLPMLRLVPPVALYEALASIVRRPSVPEKQRSAEDLKAQRGNARKVCHVMNVAR
jgi:hypothetical protein